ncbi:autophagy-related protein 2 homolog B-like [Lingula anatina]|uniref:Autophagy-related protein 2 n=1 Tax=Lingula anatina TaxID=7574 RepID=A0A1S3HLN6_LINAN|nr:autophagy-related protein 2 homolog B-like [Lingula anatina]|eukprot:XP_013385934.1 autophagy-related protein 2 homolog B-like [Lingula anatina]
MPWYFPWSDAIKKRACRYLLQRYMGHFLQEKVSLEQLTVDLYNGTGTIKGLSLDVKALNETLDGVNMPFEIVDGYVGEITVSIPWKSLTSDSTCVEVDSLELTLQPKQRNDEVHLDSMFMSMTSSIQLAQEMLQEGHTEGEQAAETAQPFEGLEMFAQTIESVLCRVKLNFTDTIVRLEHLPAEAKCGIALEIRINRIEYFDESATDQGSPVDDPMQHDVYKPAAIAHKNFHITGMTFFCDEFAKTFSRSNSMDSQPYSFQSADTELNLSSTSSIITRQPQRAPINTLLGPHEKAPTSEPLQIAACQGKQNVKIRIKQNDSIPGPRFELDCQLGPLNVFLSPRQLHMLLLMAETLSAPGSCDSDEKGHSGNLNKPMNQTDFQRVEQDLQRQMQQDRMQRGQERTRQPSWRDDDESMTTHSLDDSRDDLYFSLGQSNVGIGSMQSSYTSSYSTKTASSVSTGTYRYTGGSYVSNTKTETPFTSTLSKELKQKTKPAKGKDPVQKLLEEPGVELNVFKVKMSFLSLTLLHEDPQTSPGDVMDEPEKSATEKLKEMGERYFQGIKTVNPSGMTPIDLVKIRERISEICPYDHIGCLGKPLTLHCQQKSLNSKSSLSLDISLGIMEVVECLFDRRTSSGTSSFLSHVTKAPIYSELLIFHEEGGHQSNKLGQMYTSVYSTPCFKMKIQSLEKPCQSSRRQSSHSFSPGTEVHIELGQVISEVDISIVDRLNALLNPLPLEPQDTGTQMYSIQSSINTTRQMMYNQAMDENVAASGSKVDLHVTSDCATINLRFPIPDLRQSSEKYPWWLQRLHKEVLTVKLQKAAFHTVLDKALPTSEYELTCEEVHGLFQESSDKAPVSFLYAKHSGDQDRDMRLDWPRLLIRINHKVHSVLEEVQGMEASMVEDHYDSLNGACGFAKAEPTPFSAKKVMYESEEMVMPGDAAEMKHFRDKVVSNVEMEVELTVPQVSIILPDKNFFELLYNRLNSDLLLWEPLAPPTWKPPDIYGGHSCQQSVGLNLADHLLNQMTGDKFIMCKSAAVNDSDSDSEESGTFYSVTDPKVRQRRKQLQEQKKLPSKICFTLNISKGRLTACVPIKKEDASICPEKHGQLLLDIEDGSVFAVTNYNGDPSLRYLYVTSNRAEVYHNGCTDIPREWPPADELSLDKVVPQHLHPTIYPTENGAACTTMAGQAGKGKDSIDMLSVAVKINKVASQKNFLVALEVKGGTLQHRMAPTGQGWFGQILEFLDVKDYPVLGYTLPTIVTELHVYLRGCAIDYRPLYLPYRAMVTVESFSVSSNIIADSCMSLLRFLVDDAALYLSDKCNANRVDLKKNYVCVLDLGNFELALRTTAGKDLRYPKTDLRASCNKLHIRSCSDSFRALLKMISYLSEDGDLVLDSADMAEEEAADGHSSTAQLQPMSQLSQSHLEKMNTMMADAMQESQSSRVDMESSIGESFVKLKYVKKGHNLVVQYISPKDGKPAIRVFTSEPLKIVDNHFHRPLGKTDQLKAPDHFPNAVYRYTLKELSLVWYMYGGRDFGDHDKGEKVHRSSSSSSSLGKAGKPGKANWHSQGGPGRDSQVLMELQMNKIRLQHEVYPENTREASRQILIINQVEIRDRLASSQINKFLYQYTSEATPRQTHANMVFLKAMHIRPDLTVLSQKECSLRVSLLPLRLNIDQDALIFLRTYINEICDIQPSPAETAPGFTDSSSSHSSTSSPGADLPMSSPGKGASSQTGQQPVMGMAMDDSQEMTSSDAQELMVVFDELKEEAGEKETSSGAAGQPVYFKNFIFSPDVPIRLDYHGKRLDMAHGRLAGLLAGLAQLNCSELKLKRLNHKAGHLGAERVAAYALKEWLQDIKTNQLPSILGGVGPMHTLVQLVQGIRDLFWLPYEQYQKDGRIVRGLQRGASSFGTSTAMAALDLTNRLVQSVQYVAELTYVMVSPVPSIRQGQVLRPRKPLQPADLRQGVSNAAMVFKEGFTETATNIIRAASEEHDNYGYTGAVGGVLRQIPGTVVQPVIITAEATSNILGGMRNQLVPDGRREASDKWRAAEDD